jgi:hypothetical protein
MATIEDNRPMSMGGLVAAEGIVAALVVMKVVE